MIHLDRFHGHSKYKYPAIVLYTGHHETPYRIVVHIIPSKRIIRPARQSNIVTLHKPFRLALWSDDLVTLTEVFESSL